MGSWIEGQPVWVGLLAVIVVLYGGIWLPIMIVLYTVRAVVRRITRHGETETAGAAQQQQNNTPSGGGGSGSSYPSVRSFPSPGGGSYGGGTGGIGGPL